MVNGNSPVSPLEKLARSVRAMGATAMCLTESSQECISGTARLEQIRRELESVATCARNVLDADGYVKLELLIDQALKVSDPRVFLDAVNVVTAQPVPMPCQCWWCRFKRWVRMLVNV